MARWSEDKTKKLLVYIKENKSVLFIAEDLGVTRSAVICKLKRMGVDITKVRSRTGRKSNGLGGVRKSFDPASYVPTKKVMRLFHTAADGMKPTGECPRAECHWPIETDQKYFCAQPAVPGRSYCTFHCDIAYIAPTDDLLAGRIPD